MTWVKLDDQLHAHPKIQRAWREHYPSLGLHMLALSYAGAFLTDGQVSQTFVAMQLPGRSVQRRATEALVGARLWEPSEEGWLIHDYLDHNFSREHMLDRRPSRARGGAGARASVPTPDPFPSLSAS